jgi:hypothetical protein
LPIHGVPITDHAQLQLDFSETVVVRTNDRVEIARNLTQVLR